MRLPVGLVYDEQDRVVHDPDKQVREAVDLFFKTFRRLGSAFKTAKHFREQGLKFPKRIHCGPNKGELVWAPLTQGRATQALHSPRYSGAYAYGRSRITMGPEGASIAKELPIEQWHGLIPDAHAAYISWNQYKHNRRQLEGNTQGRRPKTGRPPREGPALLQGLAVCGMCGRRMTVRYYKSRSGLHPKYVCSGRGKDVAMPKCQSIAGQTIDEAIGALLLEAVTPVALEVSLAVHEQVR